MTSLKTCTRCQKTLPVTDFHRDRQKPDGLRYECKVCVRAGASERSAARREARRAARTYVVPAMKVCPECGVAKPPADYSPDLGSSDGLTGRCKPCGAARSRARYAAMRSAR